MRVFVGIPLLHEYGESFIRLSFKPRFKSSLRLSQVEPHITLKAPQEVYDSNLPTWMRVASKSCAKVPPFTIEVEDPFFITPMTLTLSVVSAELIQLHTKMANRLSSFNSPGNNIHEGAGFRPHITVGRAIKQLDPYDRQGLITECRETISPKTVAIRKVRLYGRRSLDEGYQTLKDIELSGSS